jgi:hypothetical protein
VLAHRLPASGLNAFGPLRGAGDDRHLPAGREVIPDEIEEVPLEPAEAVQPENRASEHYDPQRHVSHVVPPW